MLREELVAVRESGYTKGIIKRSDQIMGCAYDIDDTEYGVSYCICGLPLSGVIQIGEIMKDCWRMSCVRESELLKNQAKFVDEKAVVLNDMSSDWIVW